MSALVTLVCGYRRTGKDKLYEILSGKSSGGFKWRIYRVPRTYGVPKFNESKTYMRVAFADALKREAAEEYKIPPVIPDNEKDVKKFRHHKTGEMVSARDIYIEWGAVRREQDINYWCKAVLDSIPDDSDTNCVITDWRYLNELKYVLSTGVNFAAVRLYRSDVPEPSADIESEHNLDYCATDYLLLRDDLPGEFERAVKRFPQYHDYESCDCI